MASPRILQLLTTCLALPIYAVAGEARSGPLRVALFDDIGASGAGVPKVTEQLAKAADISVKKFKGAEIAAGVLKDFDVVVFTGGSGSKEAASLGEAGRAEVQSFVTRGGGYVGICAGAYLACSGFSWGLGILDAKTVSPKWQRGRGEVEIEILPSARESAGLAAGKAGIRYANGPIIAPHHRDDIPDFETVAVFQTELAENGSPVGAMVGAPAMARGSFGAGRVLISSPHPEQTAGMEGFIEAAVRWVASPARPQLETGQK